jgi:hypothetical protein
MKVRSQLISFASVVSLVAGLLALGGLTGQAAATTECQLSQGPINHVISIVFDNTHYIRDRANVPSDLEQMPHLLNFIQDNGTLLTNDHTILISHTAGGILSGLTGLYPDRQGQTVSNAYRYFKPDGTTASSTSFKYWTDLVDDTSITPADPLPNMVTDGGLTTPAPWVPYTRAGCDFGGVGTANIELENTGTGPFGDISQVFGCPSAECTEATNANAATPRTAEGSIALTDFVGIAIHCADGGGICADPANESAARPDRLPDEPGGYADFQGLFGAKYVNPAITGGNPAVNDTDGNPVTDPFGQPGFPGFDEMLAKNTLGYVAQMQEAGIPVTYAYISDAHDNHTSSFPAPFSPDFPRASGPGETDYQDQLAAYDDAFQIFFDRLAAVGIDKSNTLFAITVDEGDHFAGGTSTDGTWSHTFCNVSAGQVCPSNQVGEPNLNINTILPSGYTPPTYTIHNDSAPTFYINGNPNRNDVNLRQFERNLAAARAVDPYVSGLPQPVTVAMADTVGEQALHMVNADFRRTPNFTLFGNPDFFMKTTNTSCGGTTVANCIDYHFAWSHGDIQPEIATTWLGLVGPGVKNLGVDSTTWTDHVNLRPTILLLAGLKDDYVHDGRVLVETLNKSVLPQALVSHGSTVGQLLTVYEQLNAPFGQFGLDLLTASTRALASGTSGSDATYTSIENSIQSLTNQRNDLANKIKTALGAATFDGQALKQADVKTWISQAQALIQQAHALANP